jgi:hypothetical protein
MPNSQKIEAFDIFLRDETLPIKYKPKHPKKGEHKEWNGRTHVQEDQKNPPRRVNHKGNIKFPNPLLSREAY